MAAPLPPATTASLRAWPPRSASTSSCASTSVWTARRPRAFDPARDPPILVCGRPTGRPVGQALPQALFSLRGLAPTSLEDFKHTLRNKERDSFAALLVAARRSWVEYSSAEARRPTSSA